ncbi:hypothetical protein D1872_270450 [compost metagenome]
MNRTTPSRSTTLTEVRFFLRRPKKDLRISSLANKCHLPVWAASLMESTGASTELAAILRISSSDRAACPKSLDRSSVEPVAIARKIFFWLSISIVISTVSSLAPDWTILSITSLRIRLISSSVGLMTVRSICSLTMASATPIVEI